MHRRNLVARIVGFLTLLAVLTACQDQTTGAQTIPPPIGSPVPTPTPQALPTQITQGEIETPTPSGLVAGTVLADQTLTLDVAQPTPQEIAFEGRASAVIRVRAARQNIDQDYRLELLDKYGTALAQIDSVVGSSADVISEISLPYDGSYRLKLTPTAGAGAVQFTAAVIESATGGGDFELLPIQSSGTMSAAGVYHLYKFRLTEGETVSAAVEASAAGAMNLILTLIGPDGRTAASGSPVVSGFIAPASGTYQAVVSNPRGGAGDYVFRVWSDTLLPTPGGAADISYDQQYRATFANDSDLSVTFDGTVGDILKIDVTDPDRGLNIDIYLFSPYDHIIAFAVDGALNEMQLPYSGRYRLELRPTGSGEAAFAVTRLPSDQLSGGGVFGESVRETRSSEFSAPNVFHYYQFTAVPHDVISVTMNLPENSDLIVAMALLSPAGQEIAFVESGGDLSFGLSSVSLRQIGTYTIIVYALNSTEGLYDLTFVRE